MIVATGLSRLLEEGDLQKGMEGKIGLVCHSASITPQFEWSIGPLQKVFSSRLAKLFGPQHGLLCNVQDNMVESQDFQHPFFKVPVHSLYSHTRQPTPDMLDGLSTLLVDLQDVGTRVYTYFSTLTLIMEACAGRDIEVVVLDRPNPIGGEMIEGNVLEEEFQSFVGRYPLPQRHGLTMGEMALWVKKFYHLDCRLRVIPMKNWKRSMGYAETGLPWVNPSPNLPTLDGAYTFVGTVLFEGTNISEGRGTTRSLEIVGHPGIEPFSFLEKIRPHFREFSLEGFVLRPLVFSPTFQKHHGVPCGGFQIHVTDPRKFSSWGLGQFLCRQFYQELGNDFQWKTPPYEYEFDRLPIDLINGTDKLRKWVEKGGGSEELTEISLLGREAFLNQREDILLYPH